MHRWRRRLARLIPIAAAVTAALVAAAVPAAAETPWGHHGAAFDGVLCSLGSTEVPLGSWTVNGYLTAYSLRDVRGTAGHEGKAPTFGTTRPVAGGEAGFSGADVATAAYLIAHHTDSKPERAEVSGLVAQLAGSGELQASCLGQGGTSSSQASQLYSDAQRFAGPYTVQVHVGKVGIPGSTTAVTATVYSAAGNPTPGLTVDFEADGRGSSATTGRRGVAHLRMTVPSTPSTTVKATVDAPVGLTYIATSPPSVALGDTTAASGTATVLPVLHPHPTISVGHGRLLLNNGTLAPTATVAKTAGYSGTGEITVTGPVTPDGDGSCSSLPAGRLAGADPVWQAPFSFTGDSRIRPGETPQLQPGCYGVGATIETTNSTPPAKAASSVSADSAVLVSPMTLQQQATDPIAMPGALAMKVTARDAGRASARTSVLARGPVSGQAGHCDTALDYSHAPVAARSDPTPLATDGDTIAATVTTPTVGALGCYALQARTHIRLDGRSVTVTSPLNAPDTATSVLQPRVTVDNHQATGKQGAPMTGSVQVSGVFDYAGTVTVGLLPAETVPISGCADADFPPAATSARTTRLHTSGDGSYAFRTPVATHNDCYAVAVAFALDANSAIRASGPGPSQNTAFLAGVVERPRNSTVHPAAPGLPIRALVALALAALLVLVAALVVLVRVIRGKSDHRGGDGAGWLVPPPPVAAA